MAVGDDLEMQETVLDNHVSIDSIKIGERFRKDLGDLKGLTDSIKEVGLLHPIVVDQDFNLISGQRRLEACKLLGWKKIPVNIVPLRDLMKGEFHENAVRKDFTLPEMVAIKRALEPEVKAEHPQGKHSGANLARDKTRDIVARYVGVSHETLGKAEAIVDHGNKQELAELEGKLRGVSRVYNKMKRRQNLEEAKKKGSPALPDGKYDIILADPPWQYGYEGSQRGKADNHYATMPTDKICEHPIKECFADNALLFLWVTNPLLEDGLRVVKAWGFSYITNFVWVKDKLGTGFMNRSQHELLLICRKGKMPHPVDGDRYSSVIDAPRTEHSVKPPVVYEMIERMYPNRHYLELFKRGKRENWVGWGLEAN